jgi:hypothetical protein
MSLLAHLSASSTSLRFAYTLLLQQVTLEFQDLRLMRLHGFEIVSLPLANQRQQEFE